jgi:hypothetical protein
VVVGWNRGFWGNLFAIEPTEPGCPMDGSGRKGTMILLQGEKIHVVHRRLFEKDMRKHFVGEVEGYENGMVRATGHVFVIDDPKENLFRRKPERRTRIISLIAGHVLVNVIPQEVNLEDVRYEMRNTGLRVTDGSDWHMDLKEFGWA